MNQKGEGQNAIQTEIPEIQKTQELSAKEIRDLDYAEGYWRGLSDKEKIKAWQALLQIENQSIEERIKQRTEMTQQEEQEMQQLRKNFGISNEQKEFNLNLLNKIAEKCLATYEGKHSHTPLFGKEKHPEWGRDIVWITFNEEETATLQEFLKYAQKKFEQDTTNEPLWNEALEKITSMRDEASINLDERIIEDPASEVIEGPKSSNRGKVLKVPTRIKHLYMDSSALSSLKYWLEKFKTGEAQSEGSDGFGELLKKLLSRYA